MQRTSLGLRRGCARSRAPRRETRQHSTFSFLEAGFMLVETKAVVTMALLFGSTWVVNSVVFLAVLVMILLANLWTLRFKPARLWPYYAGLLMTLALNAIVPLDFFLGMNRSIQVLSSCLLVFAPILFAGVIFAASFKRTTEPDRAFGVNIAGAMMGGLAEYSSMLLGFQYVVLVAILFYALSAIGLRRADDTVLESTWTKPFNEPAVAGDSIKPRAQRSETLGAADKII